MKAARTADSRSECMGVRREGGHQRRLRRHAPLDALAAAAGEAGGKARRRDARVHVCVGGEADRCGAGKQRRCGEGEGRTASIRGRGTLPLHPLHPLRQVVGLFDDKALTFVMSSWLFDWEGADFGARRAACLDSTTVSYTHLTLPTNSRV